MPVPQIHETMAARFAKQSDTFGHLCTPPGVGIDKDTRRMFSSRNFVILDELIVLFAIQELLSANIEARVLLQYSQKSRT